MTRRSFVAGVGGIAAGLVAQRVGWARTGAEAAVGRPERLHRVLTCNILLDLPEHAGTPMDWKTQRRDACMQLIHSRAGDLICLQEVGPDQDDDFRRAFPDHAALGYADPYVDRRPARFQGIKNVILYRRDRYELISSGQYWLSPTPLIAGSRLPGVTLGRHVTWLRLKVRGTDRQFRLLNTHWSLTPETRLKEAQILVDETAQYDNAFPQLLCGDFNSETSSPEQHPLRDAGWQDTYTAVDPPDSPPPGAPASKTLTGAAALGRHAIDYILYRGPWRPIAAERFRNTPDGRPASDHPFVSADVEL